MKRRISTYFSLLVIVTSILVAPLHAIAEMSIGETQGTQATSETSDVTNRTSESQSETSTTTSSGSVESTDLQNTEVQSDLKSETLQTSEKQSRAPTIAPFSAVDDVITSFSITDKNGAPLTEAVGQWETFRINGTFDLPNNQVKEGDTTTITLPPELRFGSNESFELKDSNGNIVANATVLSDSKQIILTYTDYAEIHSDIHGSFYFYAGVDSTIVQEEQIITTTIDVEGTTFPIEIDYAGIDTTTYPLTKSGWFTDGSDQTIQYYVAINRSSGNYPDATITDAINSQAVNYVPGSFIIYKGKWQLNAAGNDWELVNRVNVTGDYEINISSDQRSFSIDFGDIGSEDQYAIYYKAELAYTPVDGENIVNTAVLTSNDVVIKDGVAYTNYQKGGGEAEGYNYTVSILKTNESGEVLSGAHFEVLRESTGQVVGKLITDDEGRASINDLLKDNYTIKEIKAPAGYELLDQVLTVTPSDFGNDKEVTKNVVNKKIEKPVALTLEASKELTGKALSADEFQFQLLDEQGEVLQIKSNDAKGKIYFDAIDYDQAGTYKYTIREVAGTDSTITYDDTVYNVTVNVEDQSGQLVASPSYEGSAAFKNSYNPAKGSAVLEASKELTGKALSADEFQFQLLDEQGEVLQTKTNDANGKIYFDAIDYDQAGTYKYTIREVAGTDSTITYDDTVYNVTVNVEDQSGQLVASPSYEGSAAFKNSYNPAKGSAVLEASKELTGKALSADEFQFQLLDEQGEVLQTKTNDANGKIYFDAIDYDQAGTYKYTIREVAGTDSTITYDDTVYNVTVNVEDQSGQLVASPSYEGSAAFKNSYNPAKGSAVLEASKELTSKALSADEFQFQLLDEQGEVLQTKSNDANGKIYFDAIDYDQAGTYKYTIREVAGTDNTITYDDTVYHVTVNVEDQSGQLVASPSYEGSAAFKNSYNPAKGSAVLEASKELTGKALSADEFQFQLLDEQGEVLQTKSNDANGKIYFDAIDYDQAGTYKYTIREVTGTDNTITYDDTVYHVTVNVEDQSGQLVASPAYQESILFKNTYVSPKLGKVTLKKVDSETGKLLANAEFELQDSKGNIVQKKIVTNKDGKVEISNLDIGEYQLVETKAPDGYQIDKTPIKFSINDRSIKATREKELEKENKRIKKSDSDALPKTGETVDQRYILVGLFCIICFIFLIILKNKKVKKQS
ncbi:Spy0128 family protein [Enterococcus casseliflavus]|uniref:Spy0128 family protein n=1 Tax=Enterococcus casseliflavus TaxID=37734 RepID=UPI0023D82A58|nr:FctA domain-containing protein [Enterococcus casseliflavus]WEI91643.1 FctA domain-containing protein [Enterococcus casseliflavus]